ncbi:hypothetical protein K9M79_02320 [Candidatus Woesearchaeota archaeon]|nr:hypothetical protein [Candidatus Woesearchaeota archaeon]
MTIVGFNFTKINVEKDPNAKGKIKINNNVSVKNVEKADLFLGDQKQSGMKFLFLFTSKYDPGFGKIELEGEVLYLEEDEKIKEVLAEWKKNKKIGKEIMTNIFNSILTRCNIQALILSQTVNLPPPIPMPKVSETPAK